MAALFYCLRRSHPQSRQLYTPVYEVFAAADAFESGTSGHWGNITGGQRGLCLAGRRHSLRQRDSVPHHHAGRLITTTVGASVIVGDIRFFAGYHDQRNRHSALLSSYIGGWDASIAPSLAPLGMPTATTLRNVANIINNTQIDAAAWTLGSGRLMGSLTRQPALG